MLYSKCHAFSLVCVRKQARISSFPRAVFQILLLLLPKRVSMHRLHDQWSASRPYARILGGTV
jgi:hypothetical protein